MTTPTAITNSGLTNQEISAATGVNTSTAWRWRTGQVVPKIDDLAKLAKVLGCRPADLRPDLARLFK